MITDELSYLIRQELVHTPTREQAQAIHVFCQFLTDRSDHVVMILRGCAGTGKTTLAGAIVRTMLALKQKVMLLAPTGRAAKVFSLNSGHDAYTIHRRIYRQKTFEGDRASFNLNFNKFSDMLFMVDEASMISRGTYQQTQSTPLSFGSGCLLDDLLQFVYSGHNCRLMMIGDKAQLPPVGEEESPALMRDVLQSYGMKVYESDLNEVLRQAAQSGILYNATVIRQMLTAFDASAGQYSPKPVQLPRIRIHSFADIQLVPGNELIEQLNSSYSSVGIDDTIVITRSNKRANIYNQGIRNSILDREDQLNTGDLLMTVKNNYFWVKPHEDSDESTPATMDFIANGDRAKVLKVRNVRELYGFRFADVWLQFPDYDDFELLVTVILDSLLSDAPAMTHEQNEHLFQEVMNDYADIPFKAERLKKIREDAYYNALQVKFAYAITCHKAQGGQWSHVYIDQGYMTDDMLTPDYIHWLYTAFTRSTEKIFLVNWPKNQLFDQTQ